MLLQNDVTCLPVYMLLGPKEHSINLCDPPTGLQGVITQATTVQAGGKFILQPPLH